MQPHDFPPVDHSAAIPVTEARVYLSPPVGGPLLARARVVLGGCLVIAGIRVVEMPSGRLLVAMPSRPVVGADGGVTHRDLAYPITHAMRLAIERAVLDAYRDALAPEPEPDPEPAAAVA